MHTALKTVVTAASTIFLAGTLLTASSIVLAGETASSLEEGKKLAFDRKKGNCLACHMIAGGDQAGNIGPPLIAMKARFPDKAALRAQISDARIKVPNTIMIPFGPHGVLTPEELDKITDFIYSL